MYKVIRSTCTYVLHASPPHEVHVSVAYLYRSHYLKVLQTWFNTDLAHIAYCVAKSCQTDSGVAHQRVACQVSGRGLGVVGSGMGMGEGPGGVSWGCQ